MDFVQNKHTIIVHCSFGIFLIHYTKYIKVKYCVYDAGKYFLNIIFNDNYGIKIL